MLFFQLSIRQRILKKNKFTKKCYAAQLCSTLIRAHISWELNQYIRMIPEGSCDTEDWSYDDDENIALSTQEYILF